VTAAEARDTPCADLIFEGAGVKGIAHLGAATALEGAGYGFHRIAGTSSGAIAGAFVASATQSGKRVAELAPLLRSGASPNALDYARIPDRHLPVLGVPAEAGSLVEHFGLNSGDYLHGWLHGALRDATGIQTFGDLRLPADECGDLAPDQRYRLVVVVADLSRGSVIRLPWDYRRLYGLDPDTQLVADAVLASASIPLFFRPRRLPWGDASGNVSYLVDGGTCSGFPVEIFDRADGQAPGWPALGLSVNPRLGRDTLVHDVRDLVGFAAALYETAMAGNDQIHLTDPCVVDRTIFIDTSAVGTNDWNLSPAQQHLLFSQGEEAATRFLRTWSWDEYRRRCSPDAARIRVARGAAWA
jgi:NTE family protein